MAEKTATIALSVKPFQSKIGRLLKCASKMPIATIDMALPKMARMLKSRVLSTRLRFLLNCSMLVMATHQLSSRKSDFQMSSEVLSGDSKLRCRDELIYLFGWPMRAEKPEICEHTELETKVHKRKQKGIISISQCEGSADSQMKPGASSSSVFSFVEYLHNVAVRSSCILYEPPQLVSRKECNQVSFILQHVC